MNNRGLARLILAFVCGVMVWHARRAFDTGSILISWDFEGHLLRAQHVVMNVNAASGFTAWFPYWHGGFPLQEVYPPLASGILAIFTSLGIAAAASRPILVGTWVAIVPVSYYFLRSFGAPRVPAALGASLGAALSADFTFGVGAIFYLGLLPNALGLLFSILLISHVKRLVDGDGAFALTARTAVVGGLTILAHPLAATWSALASAMIVIGTPWGSVNRRVAPSLGIAAVWAVVIGAFYWLPFLANRHNMLVTEPFEILSMASMTKSLLTLKDLGGPVAALLAVGGILWMGSQDRADRFLLFVGLLVVGFVLTTGLLVEILPFTKEAAGRSQWRRFEGFYAWSALMAAAACVEAVCSRDWRTVQDRALAGAVVAVVLGLAYTGLRRQGRQIVRVSPAALESLEQLSDKLGSRLRTGDFILGEDSQEAATWCGSPHFFNQRLPQANPQVWDQGGSLPEGIASAERLSQASQRLPSSAARERKDFADAGVRFIATLRRESRDALDRLPWLSRIWVDNRAGERGMALYEVVGFDRRFGLPPALSNRLDSVEFKGRSGYHLLFVDEANLTYPVPTAISFHPWLRAEADGAPVGTAANPQKRLVLASGPATAREITIAYSPPGWILPIRALAILAFVLGVVASLFPRRSAANP